MIAAKMANMPPHRPSNKSANLPTSQKEVSQAEAAQMLNTSERSLRSAKTVQEFGVPELSKSVETGKMAVSDAARVARMGVSQGAVIVLKISYTFFDFFEFSKVYKNSCFFP